VLALYDYAAQNTDELALKFDDQLEVVDADPSDEPGWLKVKNEAGAVGIVPANYVEPDSDCT
jgi:hypothetical protein